MTARRGSEPHHGTLAMPRHQGEGSEGSFLKLTGRALVREDELDRIVEDCRQQPDQPVADAGAAIERILAARCRVRAAACGALIGYLRR